MNPSMHPPICVNDTTMSKGFKQGHAAEVRKEWRTPQSTVRPPSNRKHLLLAASCLSCCIRLSSLLQAHPGLPSCANTAPIQFRDGEEADQEPSQGCLPPKDVPPSSQHIFLSCRGRESMGGCCPLDSGSCRNASSSAYLKANPVVGSEHVYRHLSTFSQPK